MPRTCKRKAFADSRRREYSADCLNKAVSAVIDGTLSSYSASHQYDVPRGTVARHVAYYKRTGQRLKIGEGRPTYLSHDEGALLVSIIQARAEAGFPMDKSKLRDLIAECLPNVGKESYFSHGRPGQDWYNNFMHRWRSELSVRKPELLTLSRALACNKAVVDAWFSILGNKLTQLGLRDHPSQIFNCDESGLCTNLGMSKIITKRGSKNPVQVIPGSGKEQFTVLALANASGIHYPPFVVFTGKNLYDVWMSGGPKGALYGTSENGWMDTNLFASWFKQGFIKWTAGLPRPLLLIYDGHMSHISLEVVDVAIKNQVHLLCLPPHCSHLLQPLDVGVFKPLKDQWRKLVKDWYKESRMKTIDKGQFSKLLAKLYTMLKPQSAVSGFAKCGIYPFDPSVIATDKLAPAATFNRDQPFPTLDSTSGDAQQSTSNTTPGENIPCTPLRAPTAGCSTQS